MCYKCFCTDLIPFNKNYYFIFSNANIQKFMFYDINKILELALVNNLESIQLKWRGGRKPLTPLILEEKINWGINYKLYLSS